MYVEMFRGDTKQVNLTFKKDGVSQNITGWSIWFTAKRAIADADSAAVFRKTSSTGSGIVITSAVNGEAQVTISPSDTNSLEDVEVNLICDVQAKDGSLNIVTTGYVRLLIKPDVTRSTA